MSDLVTTEPMICARCGREIPLPGQYRIRGVDRYHVGCLQSNSYTDMFNRALAGSVKVIEDPEIVRLRARIAELERTLNIVTGGAEAAEVRITELERERDTATRALSDLRAFHDAWVEHEVAMATGDPDSARDLRAALIAAHRAALSKTEGKE